MRAFVAIVVLFAALAAACGGPPPPEEVSATWTSGDDAPLEEGDGEDR